MAPKKQAPAKATETKKNSFMPLLIVVAVVAGILAAASFVMHQKPVETVSETAPTTAEGTTDTPAENVVVDTKTLPEQHAHDHTQADSPGGTLVIPPEADKLPVRGIGNPDAPVYIEEYTSLTCSHCADFHGENFDRLKKDYIDTGKVYYVIRDYPFDKMAFEGALLARCLPEDKFNGFREMLFDGQEKWLKSTNPGDVLVQNAKLAGMTQEEIDACLANNELKTQLSADQQAAKLRYNVVATPSFVVNKGEKLLTGNTDEIFKVIDEKLGGAATAEPVVKEVEPQEAEAPAEEATETEAPEATETPAE